MSTQPQPIVKTYSSAVDGIALSTPKDPTGNHRFVTFMAHLEKALLDAESEIGPNGMRGYRGQKIGGVQFGHRASDNHSRLYATGPDAETVVQAVVDGKIDCHCTRVDPCITYELRHSFPFYGDYLRRRIRAHEKAQGLTERTPFTLWEQKMQDSGGTIGHRSSAVYPRIYDYMLKHHGESEQKIWRAEVEYKEEAAERGWENIKVSTNRPETCAGMVATRLDIHGIRPKGLEDAPLIEVVGTRPPSDWARYIKWLKSTVIPSMDKRMTPEHFEEIRDAFAEAGFIDGDGVFIRKCET
jgi:hypothetical protein